VPHGGGDGDCPLACLRVLQDGLQRSTMQYSRAGVDLELSAPHGYGACDTVRMHHIADVPDWVVVDACTSAGSWAE
jgi:hypothetical protein